jgi:hypothetical protein
LAMPAHENVIVVTLLGALSSPLTF